MTQIDNVLALDETVKFQKLDGRCLFSQWAAQSAISHHGMRPEKIRVIGHEACIPDPGTYVRIGRASFPQILFVCTDWRRKEGDLILQSFQQIRKRHPQAQLIIIGNGQPPPSACMESIVCVGPLKKNVPTELTEFVDWYRRASVFVLGSTCDPMPHVTLETNYCGIPVVATDVCAMSEQIQNGENGFLVKPDPVAFADAVDAVLVAGDSLRASSRAFVEQHFTWKRVIDRLLA
jgi:glycosyltransferase involved in cell wall biosynthesis